MALQSVLLPKWKFKLYKMKRAFLEWWDREPKTYHSKWFEFTPTWSGFAMSYWERSYDDRPMLQFYLIWGKLFIYTSQKTKTHINKKYDDSDEREWGIAVHHNALWFYIGRKTYSLYLPWDYKFIRHSVLLKDGETWEHSYAGDKKDLYDTDMWKDKIFINKINFTYRLDNGATEKRTATITVDEREWRRKIFKWFKYGALVRRSICINFDKEVWISSGIHRGSVLGKGYDMKKDETPTQCFNRFKNEMGL